MNVRFRGTDIERWKLPVSHITYSEEMHEALAAKEFGINPLEWEALDTAQKATIVAQYELMAAIEGVKSAYPSRKRSRR